MGVACRQYLGDTPSTVDTHFVPTIMKKILPAVVVSTCLLSGCFLPERFEASVNVSTDGSYTFHYAGITAFVPVLMDMARTGSAPSSNANQQMSAEAGKMSKAPDVKKASYVGNGRFDLEIAGTRQSGQPASVLDAIRISTGKDGVLTIGSVGLKPSEKAELQKLGLGMNGKFVVSLPRGAEVLNSNATSGPITSGQSVSYTWMIGSIETRPILQARLPKAVQ